MLTRADIDFAVIDHPYLTQYRHIAMLFERALKNPKKVQRAFVNKPFMNVETLPQFFDIRRWGSTRLFEFSLRDLRISEQEISKITHAVICDKDKDFKEGLCAYLHSCFKHLAPEVCIGAVQRMPRSRAVLHAELYNGSRMTSQNLAFGTAFEAHSFNIFIALVD